MTNFQSSICGYEVKFGYLSLWMWSNEYLVKFAYLILWMWFNKYLGEVGEVWLFNVMDAGRTIFTQVKVAPDTIKKNKKISQFIISKTLIN